MQPTFFITGTDTGVGKTVLTTLLAADLRAQKIRVAAFKPVCSGGRADAEKIHAALGGALTLDEINRWHFRAALAPVLAARREKQVVRLAEVLAQLRATRKNFAVTLVEGAGGLLSPLGEDFDSRDLILALRATPVIVALNRLGAVNHLLLTLAALPENYRAKAKSCFHVAAATRCRHRHQRKAARRIFSGEENLHAAVAGRKFFTGNGGAPPANSPDAARAGADLTRRKMFCNFGGGRG